MCTNALIMGTLEAPLLLAGVPTRSDSLPIACLGAGSRALHGRHLASGRAWVKGRMRPFARPRYDTRGSV